jgi:hypothetical protein
MINYYDEISTMTNNLKQRKYQIHLMSVHAPQDSGENDAI